MQTQANETVLGGYRSISIHQHPSDERFLYYFVDLTLARLLISMAPLPFEDRCERYDDIAMTLLDNHESLAAVDYGIHFTAQSTAWKNGDVKNFRTTFFPIDDEPGSRASTPQELVINLIGEVAAEGSELGARGNAWLRPDQKITDKMAVKDVLVLKMPTMPTRSLAILYENQIQTLEDLYEKIDLPVPLVRATAFPPLFYSF